MQRAFLMLILIIGMANYASAYTDPTQSSALIGSQGQIVVGRADTTIDDKFYTLSSLIDSTYSLKNIVSLSIDPLSTVFIQSDFTTNIRIEIKTTNAQNQTNTIEKILTVNYKKGAGIKYDATQYYNFENATKVEVKILEITSDATWNTTQVLILKNELTANRDYVFNCGTAITGLAFESIILPPTDLNKPDEIKVTWADPNNGQTDYDLEWAWVDQEALALYPQSGGIYTQQNIFENNATRVTVTNREYKVPLLYDGDGKLFVRVRPVQLRNDGRLIEGAWSAQSIAATFAFTGHATQLNWQASSSYAEEGKHKSVVQYFDGTLRNRQTVTKDNTTKTTVVAETFYDYQGRPVIQVLPSPTLSNIIQYAQNFNRSITTDGYPKSLYDKLDMNETICSKTTPALSTASGAAQYYSPNNPLLTGANTGGINKFIPNAEGNVAGSAYPFTETRYDPDGSGRVAAQSGVGKTHQLGSNHETKYFYTGADQKTELDPLFGTDAGTASHYFKNIVKDANGQYSISYADMHGRTIATALAGNNPQSLDPIPSYTNARKDVTKDLLPPGTNVIVGKTIKSEQPLMAMQDGNFHFQYELTPDNFIQENCDKTSICYDCLYNLKITISSDCDTDAPVLIGEKKNFTLGEYLKDSYNHVNNCNTPNPSPNFIVDNTLFLLEGAYTVTKELTLSSDAQNYYRDSVFLPANQCKTLQTFVDEEYTLLQANANCKVTCQTCLDSLGADYNAYRNIMLRKLGVLYTNAIPPVPLATNPLTEEEVAALEPQFVKAYEEAKANCEIMCNPNGNYGADYIKSIRDLMLNDMVPGSGQYARFDRPASQATPEEGSQPAQPAVAYTTLKYNIFKENDIANVYNGADITDPIEVTGSDWKKAMWYNPATQILETANPYKDLFGQIDPVNAKIANTLAPLYTKEQFDIDFIKKSWPESLLPHHPEYCKLRTLESAGMRSAYDFETRLLSITNWSDAVNAFANGAPGTPFSIVRNDPFFNSVFTSGLSSMSTSVDFDYKTEPLNVVRPRWSMWQMAQGIVFCRNLPNSNSNLDMQNCIGTRLLVPTNTSNQIGNTNGPSTCPDWDYTWTIFRTLYLTERKKYIDKYLEEQCVLYVNSADPLFSDGTYQLRFQNIVAGTYNTGNPELNVALGDLSQGIVNSTAAANLLGNQADATCRSYASGWLDALKKCPTIKAALIATPSDEITLIDNLVGVCKKGYDATHPLGASSISPNATPYFGTNFSNTTPFNGFSNFPDIIKDYLKKHGINQPFSPSCSPYLIKTPAPYEFSPALTNQLIITKPDECQCERLQTLKNEYQSSYYNFETFSYFLQKQYGAVVRQGLLDTLIILCRDGNIAGCNFLATPIAIPPILQCNGPLKICIDCNEFTVIKNNFLTEFGVAAPVTSLTPYTQAQIEINIAFANYANIKTGFNKSWSEYVEFVRLCIRGGDTDKQNNESAIQETTNSEALAKTAACTNLENIYQAYYNTYINPPSRTVDLDIRTFYGNKTPCVGDVGVFDINGNLIGNTTLNANGNQNFATVWNSSAVNAAIGTLYEIAGSCKVRLVLKPGQVAPCKGIVGMRYYTFVNTDSILNAAVVGPGCYLDFNDGIRTKVDPLLSNSINIIDKHTQSRFNEKLVYYVRHNYAITSPVAGWIVKVYHSDTLGVVGFDNYTGYSGSLSTMKNLKGYLPEHTDGIVFHSTKDSSLNTFSKIQNRNSFNGVRWIGTYGHGNGADPFLNYNFGTMDNYHDLEVINCTGGYPIPNTPANILYLHDVVSNPLNIPKLKYLVINAESYTNDIVINYPLLKIIDIQNGLLANQVDSILNQVARYTITNNGKAFLGYACQARTSASDAAYNALIARGWTIYTNGSGVFGAAYLTPENIFTNDEYRTPALSQFSEYYSAATNHPNSTLQQVQNAYTTTCGYVPASFCGTLVNNNDCDSLKNVVTDFINTNYQQSTWSLTHSYLGATIYDATNTNPIKVLPPVTMQNCISNGIFTGYPDTLNRYENYQYDGFEQYSFNLFKSNICVQMGTGFSIEFKSRAKPDFPKVIDHSIIWHDFFFDDASKTFQSINIYQIDNVTSSTGFYIGSSPVASVAPALIPNQHDWTTWHTYKYTFLSNKIQVFVDGAPTPQYELMTAINPTTIKGFKIGGEWGTTVQIDYIKFIDASGNTKWQDDFNSPTSPQIPYDLSCTKITCGPVGDAFVTYYNTRFGTNYIYEQLKSKYFQCGIIFGDCPFNNCDTLKNTLNDYVNQSPINGGWSLTGAYVDGAGITDVNGNIIKELPPVTMQDCMGDGVFLGYPSSFKKYGEVKDNAFPKFGIVNNKCATIGNGFSVEFSTRLKGDFPVVPTQTEWINEINFENGKSFKFTRIYGGDPFPLSNTSVVINGTELLYTDAIPSDQINLRGEWETIKYKFSGDKVLIFINDFTAPAYTIYTNFNPSKITQFKFEEAKGSMHQIDYVKYINASGIVKYQEDFNSSTVFSQIPYDLSCTKITCGPTGDAFTAYYNTRHGTNYTYQQIVDLYARCGILFGSCTSLSGPTLCGLAEPVAVEDSIHLPDPCAGKDSVAATIGEIRYNIYLDSIRNVFDTAYYNKCMKAGALEKFTVTYSNAEHHYTLYYYDQAGNLVRTVPPEGVKRDDSPQFLANVKAARLAVKNGAEESAANRVVPLHAQDIVVTSTTTINGGALTTNYRYNTLNQVVAQKTPDAGESKFYYDRLGRLVLSQNAKQAVVNRLSYTEYDYLGRISQVGEIDKGILPDTREQTALTTWLFDNGPTKAQITRTVYDVSYFAGEVPATLSDMLIQRNLRNRVSYTQVFDNEPFYNPFEPLDYQNRYAGTHQAATYYSYDIHGNVDSLMQDFGAQPFATTNTPMSYTGNRFKKIAYNYDLISGKVNKVSYQPGMADEFYHKYTYDAENRITMAETSHDDILWERDARYTYYKHGPLARTILGEEQVQGVDYAYTLQGWLKGVNTTGLQGGDGTIGQGNDCGTNSAVDNLFIYNRETTLPDTYKARTSINFMPSGFESAMPDNFVASIEPTLAACNTNGNAGDIVMPAGNLGQYDMGQDGRTNATNQPVSSNNDPLYGNNTRTLDAYGYSLNYFKDDYKKISSAAQAPNPFAQITNGLGLSSNDPLHPTVAKDLFNGNISAMAVSIPQLGKGMVYGYSYDQLNRITSMTAFSGLTSTNSFTPVALDKYRENISYDANGNILTYKRNGDKSNGTQGYVMDNLTYSYNKDANGNLQNNKLRQVAEAIGVDEAAYIDDIDNQTDPDNYAYDEIGNLIKDTKEGIINIEWTVYGKIKKIEKEKLVDGVTVYTTITYTYDASGNRIAKFVNGNNGRSSMNYTFYLRDASGNVMSVYGASTLHRGFNLVQKEIHLYGSSRLGIYNVNKEVNLLGLAVHNETISTFERGNKFFELSNHLGNVLVTVSDKRIAVDSENDGIINYYNADVVTANDYYPFGMNMPGRKFTQPNSSYRYGFNGKEQDKETTGTSTYDYGFRIYNPALGRFLSVDPLAKSYPWFTPYQFASNTPIQAIDIDGKEGETYLETEIKDGKEIVLRRVIEIDIYVKVSDVKDTKEYPVKDFSPKEIKKFASKFNNDLAKHYKDGKFKDKDGNLVAFKFNITPFGGTAGSVSEFRDYLRDEDVGILKDKDGNTLGTRTVIAQQTHLSNVKPPVDAEATFAPGELGEFTGSTATMNDEQYDKEDATYTLAHEIGHFLLKNHPDAEVKNMGASATKHDKAGKGIMHYYPVIFTFRTSDINPSQNNSRTMTTPGRESVNQANVTEFLKSVIDTGKRDVTKPAPVPIK
jgi:RHS repeat-associated protein